MPRMGLAFKRDGFALILVAPLVMGLTPQRPQRAAALSGPPSTAAASTSQTQDLASLPLPAQASISAVLGRDSASYHAIPQGNGLHADNPSHGLAADFNPQGVELRAGTTRWGMALSGYGYGQALSPVSAVAPHASANRVEYRRGALTEWYVNGPLGLEQGFTLEAPPGTRPKGEPLTLALALSGDLQPARDANGAGLTLRQADGTAALRYGGLSAYDATGRGLPVWLDVQRGRSLLLSVDDAGARYPLVIDPLVQTEKRRAKLTASDGAAGDLFGGSASISGDTVVVGAIWDDIGGNTDQGSAYVFVKPARGWSGMLTETAKLTASDGAGNDQFGTSVAISGDTVVVGAPNGNLYQGFAYMFVEPVSGWGGNLTENAKLTASDGAAFDFLGFSVAISGDTVVVGAPGSAAYVFVEPMGGWGGNLTENAKLTASDGQSDDSFGWSIAISGDTAVVGASFDDIGGNTNQGSAYVFVEPMGGWGGNLTETAKLTASDGALRDFFGISVAISGPTVVAGAQEDDVGGNNDQGSAYVFVEPMGGWGGNLTETAKLTASDGGGQDLFGGSVAIDGDTVVVGARGDNAFQGSAYVFVEPMGGWGGDLTENAKLTAPDGATNDSFGSSVAISGGTVVIGADNDDIGGNTIQGSAYVFDRSREVIRRDSRSRPRLGIERQHQVEAGGAEQ